MSIRLTAHLASTGVRVQRVASTPTCAKMGGDPRQKDTLFCRCWSPRAPRGNLDGRPFVRQSKAVGVVVQSKRGEVTPGVQRKIDGGPNNMFSKLYTRTSVQGKARVADHTSGRSQQGCAHTGSPEHALSASILALPDASRHNMVTRPGTLL